MFIKLAAFFTGSLAAVFPFAVGLPAFFGPLNRRVQAEKFIRVASLDAVPDDDVPRLFSVVADRTDAWNRFEREPIGAVYLVRKKGADTPVAFTATCPHLGCFVGFEATDNEFHCPCHTSAFALDGKVLGGPSPRGLDTLACKVEGDAVLVQFEKFQTGTPDKIVKA